MTAKEVDVMTMSLEAIDKELADISNNITKECARQRELEDQIEARKEQMLLNDSTILTENVWTLYWNDRANRLYLSDDNRDGFKKLRKLYDLDYHLSYYLFKKYNLYFNDGEMTLNADNRELIEFVKKFNLKVVSKLDDKISIIDLKIEELNTAKKAITDIIDLM